MCNESLLNPCVVTSATKFWIEVFERRMGTCVECGKQSKGSLKYCYDCWQKRQKPVTQLPLGVLPVAVAEADFEKSHKIADQVFEDLLYTVNKSKGIEGLNDDQKFQIGLEAARLTNYRVVAYRRFQNNRERWGQGNRGSR